MNTNKSILIIILLFFSVDFFSQVQVDKFSGDAYYGLPLITVPNFRGPSVSTSISYKSDIKVDQPASEVGLGWDVNAGGSVERVVNGVPDDWKNVRVPDMQSASFQYHYGALYFDESTSGTPVFDFDYTRYKMDTLNDTIKYHYPNYDNYYVTGMGMAGKIMPENYDYKTVTVDTATVNRWFYHEYWWDNGVDPPILIEDSTSVGIRSIETYSFDSGPFDFKTHFTYQHNMYGEVDSEYYPWDNSPLNDSSTIKTPGELTGSNFSGSGYNDSTYAVVANRNRTRTSNYIEYFTNAEIDAGVTGFLEYDASFNRSAVDTFPQAGIGAYRITDPNGYTYHYSLPVYAHYSTAGSRLLDKYYKVFKQDGDIVEVTDSTKGYFVENEKTTDIYEIRQTKKYAIRWLLTAVTGPDFVDSNSDGVVDLNDEGYWVKYNYGLWTEEFESRYPYAGASYSFSSNIAQELWPTFMDDVDSSKYTGKLLSYTETSNQVYYLNEIQTPSHTGLFIRDIRDDEQSVPDNYEYAEYTSTKNLFDVDVAPYWSGEGVYTGYSGLSKDTLIIDPGNVDTLALRYELISNDSTNNFFKIYDGIGTSGTLLFDLWNPSFVLTVPGGGENSYYDVAANSGAITIVTDISQNPTQEKHEISWESKWNNALTGWAGGRAKTLPQAKLSKMLLFDNNDLASLPSTDEIYPEPNVTIWDYTKLNRANIYSSLWYDDNDTLIDSLALQSVDLEQDYSLAQGYVNNRRVLIDLYSKVATATEVENNKHIETDELASSGKLTLNKIIYYGLNKEQTQPSHLFDYNTLDTNDNPQYNSLLQDYWGNYKSDAEGNLLRGYVSDASKGGTDAWSLRKITSPLGGTTEIIYESDEYEQVLSEDNGGAIRGPIKIFALKNVHPLDEKVGIGWEFELENQTTDFWNLKDSLPVGAIAYTAIPAVWIDGEEVGFDTHYLEDGNNLLPTPEGFVMSSGEGTLTETGSKIDGLSYYHLNYDTVMTAALDSSTHYPWNDPDIDSLVYASNGYVSYEYPVGEKVAGGGTRVKELKTSNGTDVYTIAYTYEEGTATSEAGDFSKRKQKIDGYEGLHGNEYNQVYDWALTSFDYNPFGMGSQVGYGKVTMENKGQEAVSEGKSISFYQVSDEGRNNFKLNIGRKDTAWYVGDPYFDNHKITTHAAEYIDDFSSVWGKIKAQTLADVNGNMVSKKVYEYEISTKGAHVRTDNYRVNYINVPNVYETTNVVCIFRTLPSYLKKVTTYSNGRKKESEILDRDIFTGNPIETQITSINGTTTRSETILAHAQTTTPDYSAMGAKSDDPTYDNFLNNTYSTKGFRESSGVSNSDVSDFTKSFWKDSVKTRAYSVGKSAYSNSTAGVPWYDYTKYVHTGVIGDYGLFDSVYVTDITSPVAPTSQDWRMTSEITLMDEEQNVLEQKNFKNRFSASKLGYDNRFTYTSASNSNFVSFTASGFETATEVTTGVDYYEGELLSQADTNITDDNAGAIVPHTGNYMVKVPTSSNGPLYQIKYDATENIYSLQRGRTYSASVWVHKDSPTDAELVLDLAGTSGGSSHTVVVSMKRNDPDTILIGDWIQLNVDVVVPADFTNPSGHGLKVFVKSGSLGASWFDDLQFHSRVTGSGMNVYDQRTGRVLATLSDNNFATKYVYNDAGQVIEVWKEVLGEGLVKVESRAFNFKRAME